MHATLNALPSIVHILDLLLLYFKIVVVMSSLASAACGGMSSSKQKNAAKPGPLFSHVTELGTSRSRLIHPLAVSYWMSPAPGVPADATDNKHFLYKLPKARYLLARDHTLESTGILSILEVLAHLPLESSNLPTSSPT